MASVDSWKTRSGSEGLRELQTATGYRSAPLSKLTDKELADFLSSFLQELNIRQLHGFTELGSALTGTIEQHSQLAPDESTLVVNTVPTSNPLSLKSQVMEATLGVLHLDYVWMQLETGDKTSDAAVGEKWSRQREAMIIRGTASQIYLRRLPGATDTDSVLVKISYEFTKVKLEKRYVVRRIYCTPITLSNFRSHFLKEPNQIAVGILRHLSDAVRLTAEELSGQAARWRERSAELQRLADNIC